MAVFALSWSQEAIVAKPIRSLVLGYVFTEAWHQLPKEKQDLLWSKVHEADRGTGLSCAMHAGPMSQS